MYTPATTVNNVDYTKIMQTFSDLNQPRVGYALNIESPFTDYTVDPTKVYDIVPVPDADFIYNYALKHPNTTAWGVTFSQTAASPINIQYQLWFNATNAANGSDIFGRDVLAFVRGLDEAIITVLNDPTATVKANIDVSLKDWPLIPPSRLSDSIVQSLGPVFFFCSEMIIFINVLNQIVSEKELKLRHGMEVMGLRPAVYWLSHLLSNTALVFINALFTCIFGLAFGFEVFRNTNFAVLLILFFLFGEAMVMLAFFITTLVRRSRVAILIGIFFFIIGLLFESFVFSSAYLGYIWWSPATISPVGWGILMFFPFFNFGHMFLDISTLTTGQLDQLTSTYIPGPGFPWSSLYSPLPSTSLPVYGDNKPPDVPAVVQAWYLLIMDCFVYGLLLWYFDNVIPNEFGMSFPPWFFLTPNYWGFETSSAKSTNRREWQKRNTSGKVMIPLEGDEDSDVVAARERALDPEYFPALKIVNLRKVYHNSMFFASKLDKIAVRNSCFTVEEGKLLALLGQNGAGKSTTISMLSGLTPATSGDALIYDLSVRYNIQRIRKIMGICPQHDILFDDLTAREHIELYAGLKGVPHEQLKTLIEERLKAVRLHTVADVRAGTYSGGMKRRLSLVISTIGDPKIIFMDEPTTGMDPVNRRHVWSFIEKFKRGRVIILTTHSMEEADVLGDRIAVMSKGRLRAINNSIALKTKFGTGYRISVVTDQSEAARVKDIVQRMIPGANLEDDSAGALIYQFPATSTNAIPDFVQWLEENKDGLVKSWGISQSTLEEVFLKLIREANTKFQ
nr:ATP-binding cassette sub- A member 1 [Polyrhizophydium stewartii]